jgi:hypothetical protein
MSIRSNFLMHLEAWAGDLEELRQNWLMTESTFLTFAKDRGVNVIGVITGEPAEFLRLGWLKSDGADDDGEPHFHPFRMYPLHQLVQRLRNSGWHSAQALTVSDAERVAEGARDWNETIDLAILLEPIYWPRITGRIRLGGVQREEDFRRKLADYQDRVLALIRTLDPNVWAERHASLRRDAGWVDKNAELYVLLRIANWEQRAKLVGRISGALWMRHVGEVIRRAFEEVHAVRWPEEDQAFSFWHAKARTRAFGSERPLDDELGSKPYLAYSFGLFTGSAVRWYLEGETEYYAVMEILPEAPRFGIELVNLAGGINTGRGNTALKLEAMLKKDKSLRRFSMISIDGDVQENIKTIQIQVRQGNVIGSVAIHRPDFEFANFTVQELAAVAAQLDKEEDYETDSLLAADWAGVTDGAAFEKRYGTVSKRRPGRLKGEEWGRALAKYMDEHPRRADTGSIRPLLSEIRSAVHGWVSNYDLHKEQFAIDPITFEQSPRTPP